jgi:hypothetical protein
MSVHASCSFHAKLIFLGIYFSFMLSHFCINVPTFIFCVCVCVFFFFESVAGKLIAIKSE